MCMHLEWHSPCPARSCLSAVEGGCHCLLVIGDVANEVDSHSVEEEAHHWGDGGCNHLILRCTVWHRGSEHQLEEWRKGDVPQNPLDVGDHLIHIVKYGVASQDGIIKLV